MNRIQRFPAATDQETIRIRFNTDSVPTVGLNSGQFRTDSHFFQKIRQKLRPGNIFDKIPVILITLGRLPAHSVTRFFMPPPSAVVFPAVTSAALRSVLFLPLRLLFADALEIHRDGSFPLRQPYASLSGSEAEKSLCLILKGLNLDFVDRNAHLVQTDKDCLVNGSSRKLHTPHFFCTSATGFFAKVLLMTSVVHMDARLLTVQ